jgi:hypothetical protein
MVMVTATVVVVVVSHHRPRVHAGSAEMARFAGAVRNAATGDGCEQAAKKGAKGRNAVAENRLNVLAKVGAGPERNGPRVTPAHPGAAPTATGCPGESGAAAATRWQRTAGQRCVASKGERTATCPQPLNCLWSITPTWERIE